MSISDLHRPSAAQPVPRPPPLHSLQPTLQSEAARLTAVKDALTSKLDVYLAVLASDKVTMETPLIDPEGFPRSDIDVAAIRTARVEIIRTRNDLKAVMKEMEELVHSGLPNQSTAHDASTAMEIEPSDQALGNELKPIARVDGVFPNGPADSAGLQREDLLISVGTVSIATNSPLQALANLVGASEGVVLPLIIQRGNTTLHLRLTPRTGWGGRGLLGCHVVPV